MAREVKMLGDVCPNCMRIHPPPACGHDNTAPCPACGLPFGYLTKEMDPAGPCWFCVMGRERPVKTIYEPLPVDEVFL
jgi:hypothetical protein